MQRVRPWWAALPLVSRDEALVCGSLRRAAALGARLEGEAEAHHRNRGEAGDDHPKCEVTIHGFLPTF